MQHTPMGCGSNSPTRQAPFLDKTVCWGAVQTLPGCGIVYLSSHSPSSSSSPSSKSLKSLEQEVPCTFELLQTDCKKCQHSCRISHCHCHWVLHHHSNHLRQNRHHHHVYHHHHGHNLGHHRNHGLCHRPPQSSCMQLRDSWFKSMNELCMLKTDWGC